MNSLTSKQKSMLFDIYHLMLDCVNLNHIEDVDFLLETFEEIENSLEEFPTELAKVIYVFMRENLYPIAYDPDFFAELHSEELGEWHGNNFSVYEETSHAFLSIMLTIPLQLEQRVRLFKDKYLLPYLA